MEKETPLSLSGAAESIPELPVKADALLCEGETSELPCGFCHRGPEILLPGPLFRLAAVDRPGAAEWFAEDELAVIKSISVHHVGGFHPGFAV